MSANRLGFLIKGVLEEGVVDHVFPGACVGVVTKEGERMIVPVGRFTYDISSSAVVENTIYDVSSITKTIPTSMLALRFVEEGALSLDDQVIKYLPRFSGPWREDVKILHLITYTLPYHVKEGERMRDFLGKPANELENALFARGLDGKPGSEFVYSNRGAFFMGLILEKVSGKPLYELAHEYFFLPLRMQRTTFSPDKLPIEEIVPSEQDGNGKDIRGIVHDEGSRVFYLEGRTNGTAGLFSTTPDLLTFMEMILRGGELSERRYFSEKMVREMERNQLEDMPVRDPRHYGDPLRRREETKETGLGWELDQRGWMGTVSGQNTIGKTGFTGARIVANREKGKAVVFLANRNYPKRPLTRDAFNKVSASICDIVFSR